MFATADLAFERGRPDVALTMLRELERLDLGPLDRARARFISELGVQVVTGKVREAARAWLTRALDVNPYFSPVDAPRAASVLIGLRKP